MSKSNSNINNLNSQELKELLKEFKLYRDLKKQLWNRWKKIYQKLKTGKKDMLVEYYSVLDKQYVIDESIKIYKTIFWLDVISSDFEIKENDNIKWWLKVYLDDKIIDLSYEKIEREISK